MRGGSYKLTTLRSLDKDSDLPMRQHQQVRSADSKERHYQKKGMLDHRA